MPDLPAVSVCIPASPDADGLLEDLELALDSLVVQRFLDYEVVVTDDSRDDAVEALIRTYDFGGRMRYFRNPQPLQVPLNWDEAARLSRAPLIKMLLPQDRFAHADALGRFVQLMADTPDALLGVAGATHEETGEALVPTPETVAALRRQPERLLRENPLGPPSTTIHRRTPPLDYDLRLRLKADVDFYMRALRLNPRLAALEEPLVLLGPPAAPQETAGEVREAVLMLEKALGQVRDDRDTAKFLWGLMKTHKVRNARQLARMADPPPSVLAYVQHLFAHPPREPRRGLFAFLGRRT
ncbi:glycosyltransferase [Aquabacter cavernae]|uniref:glycosyltransferase n=1 Tax=Aquabacter cavernae TaxID=2496029 RepID=UPI0013DF30D8|nr:glycosyltransferase [Aquabacter cavernae]